MKLFHNSVRSADFSQGLRPESWAGVRLLAPQVDRQVITRRDQEMIRCYDVASNGLWSGGYEKWPRSGLGKRNCFLYVSITQHSPEVTEKISDKIWVCIPGPVDKSLSDDTALQLRRLPSSVVCSWWNVYLYFRKYDSYLFIYII